MLEHKGTQRIETERLVLRQVRRDDAPVLFETCFGDPNVTKFLTYETHKSIDDACAIIDEWISGYEKPNFYLWAIALKESDKPIGTTNCEVNDRSSVGNLGYQLAEAQWGKGYMTEALSAMIKYMFTQVGVNRLEAYHSIANPASGAVMRRCGMQYEGMCREKYYCSLGYQDSHMYAILKSDVLGGSI